MIRKEKEGVKWLEFELLEQFSKLFHAVLLRHGGVSDGCYCSLNIGGGTKDDPEKIEENRKIVKKVFSLPELVGCFQVHGSHVKEVPEHVSSDEGCDGMITAKKHLGLMIKHADCQAALFYDPVHHALANVHSGWRGNVQNIYKNTIESMKKAFGTKAADLFVCISPSLGPNYSEFVNYKVELPPSFWSYETKPMHFNLWDIAKDQLKQEGVLEEHIQVAGLCTYENETDFFSYRRDKITGRNATVAALR